MVQEQQEYKNNRLYTTKSYSYDATQFDTIERYIRKLQIGLLLQIDNTVTWGWCAFPCVFPDITKQSFLPCIAAPAHLYYCLWAGSVPDLGRCSPPQESWWNAGNWPGYPAVSCTASHLRMLSPIASWYILRKASFSRKFTVSIGTGRTTFFFWQQFLHSTSAYVV